MTKRIIGVLLLLTVCVTVAFGVRALLVYAAYSPQKGDLVKEPFTTAIYYIDEDGIKHLFPTEPIFWTWFGGGWANQKIIKISRSELDKLPTGDNIMSRPGTSLIQFDDDERVFAVTTGGALCQVIENYGYKWPDRIIIIQSAFKKDYFNQPDCLINNNSQLPDATIIQYYDSKELYYLQNGRKRLITDRGWKANGFKFSAILKDVNPEMTYPDGPILNEREAAISDVYVKKTGPCVENWYCEQWSACAPEGTQNRNCQELNNCATEINKPILVKACAYVEIKPCDNVVCPDRCDGPNKESDGYCRNGDCVYPRKELNDSACLAEGSFSCSQLSGEICTLSEICSSRYYFDLKDYNNYFISFANDSNRCCNVTNAEVAGCVVGDLSVAGPARINKIRGGWQLEVDNFSVNYHLKRDGSPWTIKNIDANLYADGQLIKTGNVWARPAGETQSLLSEFASGNFTIIYQLNFLPKNIQLVIDPDNELAESNESNNNYRVSN